MSPSLGPVPSGQFFAQTPNMVSRGMCWRALCHRPGPWHYWEPFRGWSTEAQKRRLLWEGSSASLPLSWSSPGPPARSGPACWHPPGSTSLPGLCAASPLFGPWPPHLWLLLTPQSGPSLVFPSCKVIPVFVGFFCLWTTVLCRLGRIYWWYIWGSDVS